MKYAICGHLCACGCGEKVITPLSPKQWKIAYNGEDVTLYPSIGNYAFACQSHYFLTNGNIIWVGERDVEKGKRKKKGLLAKLFNSNKDKKQTITSAIITIFVTSVLVIMVYGTLSIFLQNRSNH